MIDYRMTILLNAALQLKPTKEGIDKFKKTVTTTLQEQDAEIPRLREALEIFSDKDNWDENWQTQPIWQHEGLPFEIAQEALKGE